MDRVRERGTATAARWGAWDFVYCFFVFPVLGAPLSLLLLLALSKQYHSFWIFLPPVVVLIAFPPVAGFVFRRWRRGRPRTLRLAEHVALAVLPLVFVAIGALNYSGLCLKEWRYLSDDEKIRAVVHYVARTNAGFRFRGSGPDEWRRVRASEPETQEAFLAANPDCCRIVPGGGEYHPPTFWSRLFGGVSTLVQINYVQRFPNDQGVPQSEAVSQVLYVSSCGRVDHVFFTSFLF
jgi:hypothetical protein